MGRFTISPQASSPPGRFSVGRFYVPPEEEPWQATASPLVQKRKRPDGTWETRPTPRPEGVPAVTKPPDPLEGQHPLKVFGEGVLDQVEQGATSLARLPDMANAFLKEKSGGRQAPIPILPEIARDTFESSDAEVEAGLQARLESQAARGRSPGSMLTNEIGITAASFVADPLNVPIASSAKALSGLGRASRAAAPAAREALPEVAEAAGRALSEVVEDAPKLFTFRDALRQGDSFPPDFERWALRRGVDPDDFAAMPYRDKADLFQEMMAEEKAAHLKRLEEGPPPEPPLPELTPERWEELKALNAQRRAATAPPRMSTKGLETFKDPALRESLEQVARDNFDEIYAARGPVVPVSQWHDAAGLQAKLKLAPDDYLNTPAGRTFSSDELALGKHYLGDMKRQARELEARIAAGQVDDLAAAQAEKAARNRDVVRMMAKLQGQGSSEFGRMGRMLQEALDPQGLAETPKERLQLALVKHYGAKNADAAAAIEQKAVAVLRRQAAREARKTARAATAQELSAEFSSLAANLGDLIKHPKGMGGGPVPLDPELVAVIGRMAANRVKAGVVAVEELADLVYSAIRQTVGDTISREQVKASIVEHALAKPAKLSKQEARLRTAEGAVARRVKQLEEKLAAGPQLPGAKQAAAESERLSALRQRAADLRSQIEKDPRHSLVQRYRELLDEETVDLISRLPDPTENPEALVNFLRQMEKPRFRDYMGAYAYQNMLSGPKSLVKNVGGNTVKRWMRIAEHPLSVGIEAVLAPLQGRVRERYMRELLPMIEGSYRGAPEGFRKALFVLKSGYDPERLIDDLTGVKGNSKYYEAGRLPLDPFLLSQNRAVRAFGAVNGWGIRGMQIGDVMARTRAFSSASHAWATRKALMEGKRGGEVAGRAAELLAEQPDEMIEYARRIAREDTFQDEVSNIAKLVGSARREETGLGWALQQTVRFLNVPDRLAAWLADHTPGLRVAGAMWKGGRLRQAWGTPEASDILARQAFGTAVAAAAAAWAFDGKLVGAAPRDEKLRNDFYAAGKQPWSVLIGGEWVPIRDVFGGWAAPVAAAAAFHDNALTGEPVDSEEILRRSGGAALGEMRYLLDANYMSNLSDVVEAIEAVPGQAGQQFAGLAARTAAGGLVPQSSLLRNVAIFRDPRVVDKQGPLDEIRAALPGLREDLPSRYGNLGEPLVQNTGAAGAFSPVVPTESKLADPSLAEDVERLRYTVARRRTEINRTMDQIKDARKAKDAARVRELSAILPGASDRVQGDAALARVRGIEQQIRKLRANGQIAADVKRQREVALQKRMQDILSKALKRMGEAQ